MNWVKLKQYCTESGEPRSTVKQKICEGHYRLGFHAKKDPVNGTWWIHKGRIEEWLEKSHIAA